MRRVYGDGLYISLTGRAFELWREAEVASGIPLLRMLGGLDFGPRRNVGKIADLLTEQNVPFERLPTDEAERRWPGMRFEGDVIFHEQAGTVDSGAAVTTFVVTPVIAWSFTHSRLSVSPPYFLSYQRMNRLVLNPVESTAKSVSTARSGSADVVMRCCKTGVSVGSAM